MRTVCIESPFAGDVEENEKYARACLLFCLREGVAPFASHLLYTQVLDDTIATERTIGMEAGFVIGDLCDERWFFTDRGMSPGMRKAYRRASDRNQPKRLIVLPS